MGTNSITIRLADKAWDRYSVRRNVLDRLNEAAANCCGPLIHLDEISVFRGSKDEVYAALVPHPKGNLNWFPALRDAIRFGLKDSGVDIKDEDIQTCQAISTIGDSTSAEE